MWLFNSLLLPLVAVLLLGVHYSRYGGSTGTAMVMFLACSICISLWLWGAMRHLHPAPYWRPVSPYILPGWDQPQ
jgi:hypothetical protein